VGYLRNAVDTAIVEMGAIVDEPLYRNAASVSREPWIPDVVEHLTGSPYKRAQLAYGGGAEGWRDHLRATGHYTVCNVCDQISSVIQWRRGAPADYVDGGIIGHKNHYRTSGAVFYTDFDQAMRNVAEWARPGASIFHESVPPGGGQGTSSPQHENSILRTRGSGDGLGVQLIDYGGNISGPGRARGFVGTLSAVAQESGWLQPGDAIGLLGRERFMAVAWRPYREDATRRLRDPVGNVALVLTEVDGGRELRRLEFSELHPTRTGSPQTILPVSHYVTALSGMPNPERIKATFKIESINAFTPAGNVIALVDVETTPTGSVRVVPRV
jgi:hypothetical protein